MGRWDVLDSRRIVTYTEIVIQIGRLVRKISADKLFRTQTDTLTCQAKNYFSWHFSVSRVTKCALLAQLRIFNGIPILSFVLRTWK